MSKLAVIVGAGAGYVLGARAGRDRYEQILTQARRLWSDPRVQQKKAQAEDLVRNKAPGVAEAVGVDEQSSGRTSDRSRSEHGATPTPDDMPSTMPEHPVTPEHAATGRNDG